MKKNNNPNPSTNPHKGWAKDKAFKAQMDIVFESFAKQPKTMLMADVETGIRRANICRYVAHLEEHGQIQLIRKGNCHVSNHRAGFYTTDPNLFVEKPIQETLFETT